MTKDKGHGPDGWPIELLSFFIELMEADMVSMMEEVRVSGTS